LHEIAAVESTSDQPQVIQEEEDITSALLESLINGNITIQLEIYTSTFLQLYFWKF
jgi:PP-loop superfamily ATP-utilizing enzyme